MAWPKLPKVPNWVRAIFRFRNPIFVILVPLICLPLALKGGTDANGKDLTKVSQYNRWKTNGLFKDLQTYFYISNLSINLLAIF